MEWTSYQGLETYFLGELFNLCKIAFTLSGLAND